MQCHSFFLFRLFHFCGCSCCVPVFQNSVKLNARVISNAQPSTKQNILICSFAFKLKKKKTVLSFTFKFPSFKLFQGETKLAYINYIQLNILSTEIWTQFAKHLFIIINLYGWRSLLMEMLVFCIQFHFRFYFTNNNIKMVSNFESSFETKTVFQEVQNSTNNSVWNFTLSYP